MKQILESKFFLNPDLAAKLCATGDLQLVEATTDKFWGAHATINCKAIKTSTWEGLNKLGSLLMECRGELNREMAWRTFSSSPDDSMYRPYETLAHDSSLIDNGQPMGNTSPTSGNASMSQPPATHDSSQSFAPTPKAPPRHQNTPRRGRGGAGIQHPADSQQQSTPYSVITSRGSRARGNRGHRGTGRGRGRGSYPSVQTRSQQVKRPVTSPESSTPCPTKQCTTIEGEDLFAVPVNNSGQLLRQGFPGGGSISQKHHVDDSIVIGSQLI